MFESDQNRLGLALLAAAGPSATPASFGQRLFAGMGQHDAYLRDKEEREQRRKQIEAQQVFQQMQMMQMVQAQAEKKALMERKAKDDGILQSMFQQLPGPMPDGSAGVAPRFDLRGMMGRGLSMESVDEALKLNSALNPKPAAPIVSGPGQIGRDPTTFAEVFRNPETPKADATTNLAKLIQERDALPPGHPNRALYDQEITRATTRAPAISVSVNTGQKGLDNTLKLRGEFRSEPIYKAYQETQSAHTQITQALKQASPAGDLAGATKLMKILDPGSVVRESELGMAMQASGLMDRVLNYANMIKTGQKLTPTQRTDFQSLANSLMAESTRLYNAKRGEYEGIAKRNGLSVEDVLGPVGNTESTSKPGMPTMDAVDAEIARRRGGR